MTDPPEHVPVLVVGAGPTGLALAIWLARRGIPLRIIDRNAGPAAFSRALGVQARTLEFYRQLGFADRAVEGGVRVPAMNFWVQGRRVARLPLENLGQGLTPYPFLLGYAQDQHERLLISELEATGVHVERKCELTGLEQDDSGVRAKLRQGDQERVIHTRYLAGCDGARSAVREALGIGFPGGTYERVFYVADVEASGPAIDDEGHIALDQSDLVAIFAMKGAGHVRLVGTIHGDEARRAESMSFDELSSNVIRHLQIRIVNVNWFSIFHAHHRVASHFQRGRVFLLGDAAHIHSPAGAQGLNTGVGDAVNLAWKLADVVAGRAGEALLETYELERIAFARRLVSTTDRFFTFATRDGALARWVRMHVIPVLIPSIFTNRLTSHALFRRVSQIGIAYRASPLSQGSCGRIHAGDRLPWIATDGHDNYEPLRSLDWQIHVYGGGDAGVPEVGGLPTHRFAWHAAMKGVGFAKGARYLIRPDGHVACAAKPADATSIDEYLRKRMISL